MTGHPRSWLQKAEGRSWIPGSSPGVTRGKRALPTHPHAAGAAQGVKREVDTVVRNQAERILRDLDLVKREEFDAVKDMARLAREENEALKGRIAALEAKLGISPAAPDTGAV